MPVLHHLFLIKQGRLRKGVILICLSIVLLSFSLALKWVIDSHAERYFQVLFGGPEYLGEEGVRRQLNSHDCGIACVQMVFDRRGITANYQDLVAQAGLTSTGTSLLGLQRCLELYGLKTTAWHLVPDDLFKIPLPAIAFVGGDHYVVVENVEKRGYVIVSDPARGKLRYQITEFSRRWKGDTLVITEASTISPGQ